MFYFALAAMFVRFSVIHEALAVALNLNLYLLYIVMPPTLFGVLATGGIRRTLQATSSRYWMAFLFWLGLATVFSAWRGGSAAEVSLYAKTEFLMLFVVAGLAMTWPEFKTIMYTLALAGLTDFGIGRIFMKQTDDRTNLAMGGSTIANSNDFAAHLIMMMAFVLFLVLVPKVPMIIRFLCVPALLFGSFQVISTGSRGALVALLVCVVFTFIMTSGTYRVLLIAAVPFAALAMISFLPRATLLRLSTLTSDASTIGDSSVQADAEGSAEARRELLKKSLQYTVQHPLFGVGPGQFFSYEGGESQKEGKQGMWHETHNTLTQISSECGIPALLFFLLGIGSAFRLALKTYRQARASTAGAADIQAAAFCLMLSILGFMTAAFFLSLGYRFYEPALCGLCIVLYTAAQHELASRQAKATPAAALSRTSG